jgi:hypothetical protein
MGKGWLGLRLSPGAEVAALARPILAVPFRTFFDVT